MYKARNDQAHNYTARNIPNGVEIASAPNGITRGSFLVTVRRRETGSAGGLWEITKRKCELKSRLHGEWMCRARAFEILIACNKPFGHRANSGSRQTLIYGTRWTGTVPRIGVISSVEKNRCVFFQVCPHAFPRILRRRPMQRSGHRYIITSTVTRRTAKSSQRFL